jgi:hypothetical protein
MSGSAMSGSALIALGRARRVQAMITATSTPMTIKTRSSLRIEGNLDRRPRVG